MRRFTALHILLILAMILGVVGLGWWLYQRLQPAEGNAYFFYVDDTSALPEGTEVKFRGLPVGQVVRVTLDEDQSTHTGVPSFRVDFQVNPQGRRVLNIWTFHRVTLGKETPMIGATVVMLTDERLPGGKTPIDRPLHVVQDGDGLPGQLADIGAGVRELVANANAAVRSVRNSLDARPEKLGDDRAANLALVMQRDLYPLDSGEGGGPARSTRLAAVLGSLSATLRSFDLAGQNLAAVARKDGPLEDAFAKVGTLTADLDDPSKPLLSALTDLKKTTTSLRSDVGKFGTLAESITPSVDQATKNAADMLDTLKREPWRIVWKSTKQYDDATAAAAASASPSPVANARKAGSSPATPTPKSTPRKPR